MSSFLRQLLDELHMVTRTQESEAQDRAVAIAAGPPAPGRITAGTPQIHAPGQIDVGNIDLAKRPIAYNKDGSYSTVRSMGANINGVETLFPSVADDGHIMSREEAAYTAAKTGRNLGTFKDAKSSEAYARNLHEDQAGQYDAQARRGDPTVGPPMPPRVAVSVGKPQIQDPRIGDAYFTPEEERNDFTTKPLTVRPPKAQRLAYQIGKPQIQDPRIGDAYFTPEEERNDFTTRPIAARPPKGKEKQHLKIHPKVLQKLLDLASDTEE